MLPIALVHPLLLMLVTLSPAQELPAILPKAIPSFRGISYYAEARLRPRPLQLRLLLIDTAAPGIRFMVTPPNPGRAGPKDEARAIRTSNFAGRHRVQGAINGGFFSAAPMPPHAGAPCGVNGLAVYDGLLYSGKVRRNDLVLRWRRGRLELWLEEDECPWTFTPGDGQMALGVPRYCLLLRNGAIVARKGNDLHPRSAIGLSQDKRFVFLLVIDGRQPTYSEGVTLHELAGVLKAFGAFSAINLDGGGSSTLVLQQPGGYKIKNRPSDFFPFSVERAVATHIGVFALPLK